MICYDSFCFILIHYDSFCQFEPYMSDITNIFYCLFYNIRHYYTRKICKSETVFLIHKMAKSKPFSKETILSERSTSISCIATHNIESCSIRTVFIQFYFFNIASTKNRYICHFSSKNISIDRL